MSVPADERFCKTRPFIVADERRKQPAASEGESSVNGWEREFTVGSLQLAVSEKGEAGQQEDRRGKRILIRDTNTTRVFLAKSAQTTGKMGDAFRSLQRAAKSEARVPLI